jgi:hypothetical protein
MYPKNNEQVCFALLISRVGTTTITRGARPATNSTESSFCSNSTIGIANANVFPVPVFA